MYPLSFQEMVPPSEPSTEIESDEMEIAYGGASLVPLAKAYQSGFKHSISSAYVDVMVCFSRHSFSIFVIYFGDGV